MLMLCIFDVDAFLADGNFFSLLDPKAAILFAVIWILTNPVKQTERFHPLAFIALSAVAGIIFKF